MEEKQDPDEAAIDAEFARYHAHLSKAQAALKQRDFDTALAQVVEIRTATDCSLCADSFQEIRETIEATSALCQSNKDSGPCSAALEDADQLLASYLEIFQPE